MVIVWCGQGISKVLRKTCVKFSAKILINCRISKFLEDKICKCTNIFVPLRHHSIYSIMPQMIMLGSEMIRIHPAKNTIEYSTSQGRSWSTRYSSSSCGEFIDLLPYGNELLAVTSKGIYYSTSQGRSWSSRYTSSSCGEFECLMDGGRELLAQTSKGLYYSTSSGRSWSKRR